MSFEASAFTLTDSFYVEKYGDKRQINFNIKQGSAPKIIFFWASWCVFCKDYTKVLVKYLPQFKTKGISLIGLSVDDVKKDGSKASKAAYSQFETNYWLPEASKKQLSLEVLPVMVLIDRNGHVDTIYIGSQGDKLNYFEKRLKMILAVNDES